MSLDVSHEGMKGILVYILQYMPKKYFIAQTWRTTWISEGTALNR